MSPAVLGILCAVAALLLFSGNILLTKAAVARLSLNVGFVISVSVNVLFGAVAFGIESLARSAPMRWDAAAFALFLASGVFSTYFGRWFFFEAIARLGPSKASTFQISSPLFTALVAWLFLNEHLSAKVTAAMGAALYGLYLASVPAGALRRGPWGRSSATAGSASPPRPAGGVRAVLRSGLVLGLGSSMAYAVGNVLRGAAIHRWPEPILGALLGAVSGITLHFLFNREAKQLRAVLRSANRSGLLMYTVSGMLTMSAQMFTIASMSYIPVSITALITLCTPLLIFPISYLLFKGEERITARTLLGSAVALAAIAIIVLR